MEIEDIRDCSSRLELLEQLVNRIEPRSFLEVGVWKGELAAYILARCPGIERYFMIDPWRTLPSWNKPFNVDSQEFELVHAEAMKAIEFARGKTIVLRGTTREVIDRIPNECLDMAYIDGDHSLRGISIDLISVYPKIKPGGFLAGDDFVPDIWQHGIDYEPTLVFPFAVYFAEAVGATIHALPYSQFIMEKPLAGRDNFKFNDLTGRYNRTELRSHLALRHSLRDILSFRSGRTGAALRMIQRFLRQV